MLCLGPFPAFPYPILPVFATNTLHTKFMMFVSLKLEKKRNSVMYAIVPYPDSNRQNSNTGKLALSLLGSSLTLFFAGKEKKENMREGKKRFEPAQLMCRSVDAPSNGISNVQQSPAFAFRLFHSFVHCSCRRPFSRSQSVYVCRYACMSYRPTARPICTDDNLQ